MRKILVIVLTALLAGALVAPADAAKKRKKPKRIERVAEATYDNPALGVPGVVGSGSAGGSVEFGVAAGEKFIDVEITDDGGQPVTATMSQDTDPSDASWEIFATFCGGTEEPLAIAPNLPVRVSIYTTPGPDQPNCMGPASSGTVKATFSNLP